jgi:hypothetical protein
MKYTTELGYVVTDTLSGADVYVDDNLVCELPCHLSHFEDDNGNIDDDKLEGLIQDTIEVDTFLDDQANYM